MFSKRYTLPDVQAGYELSDKGFFSVILPAGRTNLITNPSLEKDAAGYTAVGGSITRTSTWQTRGSHSLLVTPAAGLNDGVYYGTVSLTSTSMYWFGVDFQGDGGVPFKIYFASTGGTQVGTAVEFYATGRKQRLYVPYIETSTTTRRIYIVKNGSPSTRPFYIDGLQCEAGAFWTTYLDGDQKGMIPNFTDYYWTGAPHASTSVRLGNSCAGGQVVSLRSLGFRLLAIVGLGFSGITNHFTQLATGGAFYQGSVLQDRQFSLVGAITDTSDVNIQRQKANLVNAFRFSRAVPTQPIKLIYTYQSDCADHPAGDTVELPCVFEGGLEGNVDNLNQERLALSFRQYLPYIQSATDIGADLNYNYVLASSTWIISQDANGNWTVPGSSAPNAAILAYTRGPGGALYVSGSFTTPGNYVARWDGETWTAFGAGPAAWAIPYASGSTPLFVAPNGDIYVCSNANLYRYRNGTWSTLLTVTGGGLTVLYTVSVAPNGNIYIGGDFTGPTSYAAVSTNDGASWTSMGAFNGIVTNMYQAKDGYVYVTGGFTSPVTRIARTPFTSISLSTLTGTSGVTGTVNGIGQASNGLVYFGNGVDVYEWNGSATATLPSPTDQFRRFDVSSDGKVYLSNLLAVSYPKYWNGSQWISYDLSAISAVTLLYGLDGRDKEYLMSATSSSTSMSGLGPYAAGTTITSTGNVASSPIFTVRGPGTLKRIENLSTGSTVLFNLALYQDETATIDFSNGAIKISSNFRDNLISSLSLGSDVDLKVLPGTNVFRVFIASSPVELNDGGSQITSAALTSITSSNTDNGRLYVSIVDLGGGSRRVDFYKDSARTQLVAQTASFTTTGGKAVTEQNSSGLSGTVTIAAIGSADSDITIDYPIIKLYWKPAYLSLESTIQ